LGDAWEAVLIGANEDLDNIPKQFISVNELLEIFADLEKTTLEKSAQWLINNKQILNAAKKLVLKNEYTLVEYEHSDNDFYNCPIEALSLIASGEDCDPYSDYVGFSRYVILMSLKELGLDIGDALINNSRAYIAKNCHEYDDNFYKKQCAYLISMIGQSPALELPIQQENDINNTYLLNPSNPNYIPAYALLLRIHHDLNTVGRFEGTKQKRVADCLEEYGQHYGVQNTPTNAIHFSNLIKVRTTAKDEASTAMKKILSQEQK
ncbi:hypothetical protein WAI62_18425, partial [Acinetobacter baumannii]